MTEWKLFEGSDPHVSSVPFFQSHPWVPPEGQIGHAERTRMVALLVPWIQQTIQPVSSIADLGCGDGSLLGQLAELPVLCPMWGYDLGLDNIYRAHLLGLDVRHANILTDELEYGELLIATEVLEHLEDPLRFLKGLPGELLIVSSPSAETDRWHYVDHTWAWDLDGYRDLVEQAGWLVSKQVECDGGVNVHAGLAGAQRFQAIVATK